MKVTFEVPEVQAERLQEEAARLGVRVEELARAVVLELLSHPRDDFESAVEYVLAKNGELYGRLG